MVSFISFHVQQIFSRITKNNTLHLVQQCFPHLPFISYIFTSLCVFAGGAVQLVLVPPSVSVRSGLFRAANSSWPESLHTVHIIIPQCKQEPRLPWFIVASSERGDAETRKRWARGGDQGNEERGRQEECRTEEFHAMGTKVESWCRADNRYLFLIRDFPGDTGGWQEDTLDRSPGQQDCEGSSYKTTALAPPLEPSWNRVLLNAIPAAQSRRSHFCLFPSRKESERIPKVFTSRFNQINYKRWAAAVGFPVAVRKM